MKFIFGLDGVTEFEISDFAEKVNNLLKLKPSSGFDRQLQRGSENASYQRESSGVKTLFVWKEWIRYIEYRRIVIERTHVPTAIRKGLVKKMDPEYVLRFAQNEGYYHCHRPPGDLPEFEKSVLEIFEKFSARFSSPNKPQKRIPTFRPSILGMQGLAEQLLEFDSSEYGLLNQEFSTSSLVFSRKPKLLASALKKANPPHRLNIQKGPACNKRILTVPFVTSRGGLSKFATQMKRYAWKIVTVDSEVVRAPTLSDVEEEDDEDDDDDESKPSLLLHDPCHSYWVNSLRARLISFTEWNLFSAGLPPNFLWMLNLICEVIEESPRDFYEVFTQVETIIFLHHGQVNRSLMDKKEIRRRILFALRSEF